MAIRYFSAARKGIPLMQALGNTKAGLPYTLFIDRNGQVIQKKWASSKKLISMPCRKRC